MLDLCGLPFGPVCGHSPVPMLRRLNHLRGSRRLVHDRWRWASVVHFLQGGWWLAAMVCDSP